MKTIQQKLENAKKKIIVLDELKSYEDELQELDELLCSFTVDDAEDVEDIERIMDILDEFKNRVKEMFGLVEINE